ncbi:MAG: hypothetical protein OXO52_13610 [Rhodospirillales bacterium]|nr:hypothetical protein [Rhodospirillales bacterium]
MVPFPGASVHGTSVSGTSVPGIVEDGEGKSAQVSPPALGAKAAGAEAWRGGPGTAVGDETAAPRAGSEVPVTTGPDVDGEPSDAAVPNETMAGEKADAPAGGSRLLRALAEVPVTPVPGEAARPGTPRVAGTSVSGTSVFAAEGCPRALLRRLLAGAAGETDALSALGIEREILTLCRERQEILTGLFETEARLRELREAGRPPQAPVTAAGAAPAVGTSAPSPLRAALGGAAETLVPETLVPETLVPGTPDTRAAGALAAEPQALARVSPSKVSPRYAWFSIIGTAGALRAGVTDGTGVWFVQEGDPLPGGAMVAAIAGRPPGVRLTGPGETLLPKTLGPGSGETVLLPFGTRPGAGR